MSFQPGAPADLELAIGYSFRDPSLLLEALTHRSFVNESYGKGARDNQRLEFLGDAVIGLVLSREIFDRFPRSREGELTKLRASLVDETSLATMAAGMDLGKYLRLGRGEDKSGGRKRASVLADAYEALMAALFLDGGIDAVGAVLKAHFADLLNGRAGGGSAKDYKTDLQELAHHLRNLPPRYLLQGVSGPDHERVFSVAVFLGEEMMGCGSGRSKKEAERAAAREALSLLELRRNK